MNPQIASILIVALNCCPNQSRIVIVSELNESFRHMFAQYEQLFRKVTEAEYRSTLNPNTVINLLEFGLPTDRFEGWQESPPIPLFLFRDEIIPENAKAGLKSCKFSQVFFMSPDEEETEEKLIVTE